MTKQQKIGAAVAAGIVALLYFTGGGSSPPAQDRAAPADYTCESLAPEIIQMSKGREPEILELNEVERVMNDYPNFITCQARAEWSQGQGRAEFGAHKSDGGNVILSYKQL
ncbi:hypothetical protein [uncultured Sphingomonas sp.]|mgnify:CR=1 FL=1|uniref:hypothetical protein n=1 Tax=uncultured Sphingomonas sp. TaxID=158754 RepID=UPI0026083019|nr:hypothetical protein [uncultured Sphingomonas sp.]